METVMEKMKNTRILAGIGIICLFLGTILTYLKYEVWGFSYEVSLFRYWEGKLLIAIIIANLIIIFKDLVEKYIPSLFNTRIGEKIANIENPKASLIPTAIAIGITLYLHSSLNIDSDYVSYGLGFYAIWVGAICLVAHAFLHKKEY